MIIKSTTKIIAAVIIISLMAFNANKTKLIIKSSAFNQNGMIPAKYSCEGKEINPPLTISGIPDNTKTLAIIIHDPDAPHADGITHWIAWNLPVDGNIPENFKGGEQGQNSDHKTGYKGMCPPNGTHHYNFQVYALDITLQLDTATTDKEALEQAIKGHIVAQGELTGLYSKSK